MSFEENLHVTSDVFIIFLEYIYVSVSVDRSLLWADAQTKHLFTLLRTRYEACQGHSYRRAFLPYFRHFLRANFLIFHIFDIFFAQMCEILRT